MLRCFESSWGLKSLYVCNRLSDLFVLGCPGLLASLTQAGPGLSCFLQGLDGWSFVKPDEVTAALQDLTVLGGFRRYAWRVMVNTLSCLDGYQGKRGHPVPAMEAAGDVDLRGGRDPLF